MGLVCICVCVSLSCNHHHHHHHHHSHTHTHTHTHTPKKHREFELLWETCEKITTSGGAGDGGGNKGPEFSSKKDENCITFAAFKRIVQRLKMELLFLPELHQAYGQPVHLYYDDSRSCTPLPYCEFNTVGGGGGTHTGTATPTSVSGTTMHSNNSSVSGNVGGGGGGGGSGQGGSGTPVMVAPAPRVFSGLGGSDHTVPSSGGGMVAINVSGGSGGLPPIVGGRVTPSSSSLMHPDYGTSTTATLPVDAQANTHTHTHGHGPTHKHAVKFSSVDYNQKRYAAEVPVADTYAFFTAHRDPKDFMMRWLHLEGLDRLTILRFAVKYSLHPLCVEDALKLEDQQPKVNKYGAHYFIVMPFFRLSHESREALDALRQQRRRNTSIIKSTAEAAASLAKRSDKHRDKDTFYLPGSSLGDGDWSDFQFRVEWSKLCIFMAGAPSYDTVISLHGKWETFNNETDEMLSAAGLLPAGQYNGHAGGGGLSNSRDGNEGGGGGGTSAFKKVPSKSGGAGGSGVRSRRGSLSSGGGLGNSAAAARGLASAVEHHLSRDRDGSVDMVHSRHIFEDLVKALRVDYSVLRQGNSKHLMYRILDEMVDYLIPIARAYRTRVRLFQAQLHRDESKFKKEQMRLVLGMKSELQRLQRRIRPMTAVVRHLMDDEQIGADMKVYLEDVLDHVVRGLEEIGGCIEMCDSTKEEFKSLRDQKTNEVLYTLTLVTTMFVPLQFLTGECLCVCVCVCVLSVGVEMMYIYTKYHTHLIYIRAHTHTHTHKTKPGIYGMNFVNEEGKPTMPELLWPRGYLFFWCLAGTLFLGSLYYFKLWKKWI